MTKSTIACVVQETEWLTPSMARIRVDASGIPEKIATGQFFQIKCGEGLEAYLRRPISVCDVVGETLTFVVECKGKGSKLLTLVRPGDTLDLLGPLGHGFDLPGTSSFIQKVGAKDQKVAILGGGCGVAPLLYLTRTLHLPTSIYLGFRNREAVMLETEFRGLVASRAESKLLVATDDGSYGYNGFALQAMEQDWRQGDLPQVLYCCGPTPMMKRAAVMAKQYGVPCQVSLEERMGCGIGACLVCVCKLAQEKGTEGEWRHGHVCKDGPAIWADQWIPEENG